MGDVAVARPSLPQFEPEYDHYKMRQFVDELNRWIDTVELGASGAGNGTPGISVHNDLSDRNADDAHPISAITGLQTSLDGKASILKPILVTTTTHAAGDNNVILVDDDAAGATVIVFLPVAAVARAANLFYHVKKLGTTANVVINGDGSETIDGLLIQTISSQFDSLMLVPEASRWHII